ncbi:hypothetical protein OU995_10170 [Roseateles sp. SL47]|uniref:hypothetical protein n=1 Tax=Roseateles sp. SL47 TaxID=2995138 RepID=UPI00226D6258|nr:hypothetical protein [Roseateles sp. SL47]WAC75030.1 hypothetical protein OU995_10170 [Roseateles sp. SL47]
MDLAQPDDKLDEHALAPLRGLLNDQISALNDDLEKASTQKDIDAIQAVQNGLAAKATALTGLSIQLKTGEAKITAEHIQSAVDAAEEVINKVKAVKAKLALLGAVIDFAAAVLTGHGQAVVGAAVKLKNALSKGD